MRKRTIKEKKVMGKVEEILRQLKITNSTPGYMPLLDTIVYAYAFPEQDFLDIIAYLERENYYVGIAPRKKENDADTKTNPKTTGSKRNEDILSAMVTSIETTIEKANTGYLSSLELNKLNKILPEEEKTTEEKENDLLSEIGEKYKKYTYDEKIIVYFSKKILKYL